MRAATVVGAKVARWEILNTCMQENRLPNTEERKRLDALAPRSKSD